jgi:hypothetical protein
MKMVKEEALKKRTNVSQDVNLLAGSRAVMFNAWHQLVGLLSMWLGALVAQPGRALPT